jgi:predicted DNA-binding transcriptional regulator YafY
MKNKQAHIRFMTIDALLRGDSGVFMQEMIEACRRAVAFELGDVAENIQISKRTIQEDLKFFRESYKAPIIEERRIYFGNEPDMSSSNYKRKTYRYADPDFSIAKVPITRKERENMIEALAVLYRLSHMKSLQWLKEPIQEIQLFRNESLPNDEVIAFEENHQLKGLSHLSYFYHAIHKRQVQEIRYYSHREEQEFVFVVSPYFLKQFNKRWFLFGKTHEPFLENPHRLINLPLDRIIAVKKSEEAYHINEGQKPSEYFRDIVGVSFDESAQKEKIILEVDGEQFHYLESKPLHRSQELLKREVDRALISIEVYPNFELESLILSYGEGLKVIAPEAFRSRLVERIKKVAEKY